ncbi:MAG: hypothetical protein KVP17_000346 [Porospora cf. gigantea B]|uniref:uncharacterized protein n=1 Tax=Porospora cf. gigantea B TaxID=2853592 RepID=UPI003571B5AA|nr:MAG: hypothetical protein KVP17_000346 [Porospora cf. gigantea B]
MAQNSDGGESPLRNHYVSDFQRFRSERPRDHPSYSALHPDVILVDEHCKALEATRRRLARVAAVETLFFIKP